MGEPLLQPMAGGGAARAPQMRVQLQSQPLSGTGAVRPAATPGMPGTPPDALAEAQTAAGALALYARLLAASSVESAAHALVAALAVDLQLSRVSFALHEHGRTRLLASSSLDLSNPLAELPQRLLGAASEAIEQGLTVAWPPAGSAADEQPPAGSAADDQLPAGSAAGDQPPAAVPASGPARAVAAAGDPICVEHRSLQRLVGGAVATIALGARGEASAALCLERHQEGASFSTAELARVTDLVLLAEPALRWMRHGTQRWHRRLLRDLGAGIAALRQPSRRTTRRLMAGGALLLLFLALAPLEFHVSGRARIEGGEQRVLSAPADGFVKAAHARPGDRVRAGAPLVDLLEEDLRLERDRWSSQLAQHENAYASAMARSERVAAATSMARVEEAQAQLALIDEQLTRGRITAPFDAMVIEGDLSRSIGAPVRQGDKLLTLATTDVYRVIAEIDEIDIGRVEVGQGGELALSSLPWDRHPIVVERIAPLARAVDGRNIFEVEARLTQPPQALRPGLLGRAEVVVGRSPPLWVWTGQAIDRIRLAWWKWLG